MYKHFYAYLALEKGDPVVRSKEKVLYTSSKN